MAFENPYESEEERLLRLRNAPMGLADDDATMELADFAARGQDEAPEEAATREVAASTLSGMRADDPVLGPLDRMTPATRDAWFAKYDQDPDGALSEVSTPPPDSPVATAPAALGPPQQRQPAPITSQVYPQRDALMDLADRPSRVQQPPRATSPNTGLLIGAGVLDMLLNRGRNLGGVVHTIAEAPVAAERENWQRQQEYQQAVGQERAIDVREALAQRAMRGESRDPDAMALKRDALDQRRAEFEERKKGAEAKRGREAALASLDSMETRAQQDAAIMVGMPEEQARVMTGAQILQWRPQIGQVAHSLESNEEWRKRFGMSQSATLAKEGRESERDLSKEERTEERVTGTRAEDFAEKYATKYDKDLAIAGLMQDIDRAGGAAPQSFSERFKGALAARGVDPERLEAWRAKQLVVEEFLRKQTGAAISLSEEDRGDMLAGLAPAASEADATAAYNVMKRNIRRYLRMGAAANPSAARSVTRSAELDDSWLAGIGDANPNRGGAKPAAKPAAAPAKRGFSLDSAAPAQTAAGVRDLGEW